MVDSRLKQQADDLLAGLVGGLGPTPGALDKDGLRKQAQEFFETLLLAVNDGPRAKSVPADDRVPLLHCEAPVQAGTEARAVLTVSNEETTPSDATLYCTSFVADSGHEIPALRVTFSPRRLTIPAGGEATFQIRIVVPHQAAAGLYSGLIQAMGTRYVKAVLSREGLSVLTFVCRRRSRRRPRPQTFWGEEMHSDLVELGWTEDQWNRIQGAVTEEAQKARVAAQMLPLVGPIDRTAVAVPSFELNAAPNPMPYPPPAPQSRLTVNSDPNLFLTRIAVNVPLRSREAADPDLAAALVMFRRAANYIARFEDALVFNGRPGPNQPPPFGVGGIPDVVQVTGDGAVDGLCSFVGPWGRRALINVGAIPAPPGAVAGPVLGDQVVTAIIQAINQLDMSGQLGPYCCVLSPHLFEAICTPNSNLVLPRDRILPFLQGPLLRSSAIFQGLQALAPVPSAAWGAVIATSGNPVELVVASDIHIRFLQTAQDARLIFRVSERIAVRIQESSAIALLQWEA